MTNNKSNPGLKNIFYAFIAIVAVPTLVLSFLGIFGLGMKNIGSTEGIVLLISLIPILFYFNISFGKLKKINFTSISSNKFFPQELSISFYIVFLIFMITILFSFNLMITGFFLLNGEVPMGMEAVPEDAYGILGLSVYLFFSSVLGIYYLVHSKRILRPKKSIY